MANLYGVANPVIMPVFVQTVGATNIVCNPGAWTPIATSTALQAISSGIYYPSVLGQVVVQSGATQIGSLQIGINIGAGAVTAIQTYSNAPFAANSIIIVPVTDYGLPSTVPWQGLGSTVSVNLQPAGQAATALFFGSYFWISLYRAPDQ